MLHQIGAGGSNNMNMHVLSQEVQTHQWPSSSSSSSSFTSQAQPDGIRQSQDLDINRVCPLPLPLPLEEMVPPPALREASSWPPLPPAQLSYNNTSIRQLTVAGDCSNDRDFPPFLQYDSNGGNNNNNNNSSSSCDILTPSSPTSSQVLQQASPPTHSPPPNQLFPFLISSNSPVQTHALLESISSEITQDQGGIHRTTKQGVVDDKEPPNDHSSEDGEVVNNSSKKAKNLGSHLQGVLKKEKLGDKITALQQLVSPFGKTDTASVLLEAIGYIKFLQDQVQVLSSPYMKSTRQDTAGYNSRTSSGTEMQGAEDLRSRGLCLVPVSCTLNMANNNGADYWASGMGGGSSSRYS